MTRLGLINPCLVSHRDDYHSSGIPYMPHGLAQVAGVLRDKHAIRVWDLFGLSVGTRRIVDTKYLLQGLSLESVRTEVEEFAPEVLIFYASSVFNFEALRLALGEAQKIAPQALRLVIENTQAVTGFSLSKVTERLEGFGAQAILCGEPEVDLEAALVWLLTKSGERPTSLWVPGVKEVSSPKVVDIDALPLPAWELFPLQNYWTYGVAHAPYRKPYLPLLSSRGCPFPCDFCSIPVMNSKKWRARSVRSLVEELKHFHCLLGVTEFHFEDVNPTVHEKRISEFCEELLQAQKSDGLFFSFQIASGTKLDKFQTSTLAAMREAGFDYLSISPESGSPRVLQAIGKPFQHDRALELLETFCKRGGAVQCCFVIGHPAETETDLELTRSYLKRLARIGVGEVAIFMITPMPGTPLALKLALPAEVSGSLSDLTFTPSWRTDFEHLERWRRRLYRAFFWTRLLHHAAGMLATVFRALRLRPPYRFKGEMLPRRLIQTWIRAKMGHAEKS